MIKCFFTALSFFIFFGFSLTAQLKSQTLFVAEENSHVIIQGLENNDIIRCLDQSFAAGESFVFDPSAYVAGQYILNISKGGNEQKYFLFVDKNLPSGFLIVENASANKMVMVNGDLQSVLCRTLNLYFFDIDIDNIPYVKYEPAHENFKAYIKQSSLKLNADLCITLDPNIAIAGMASRALKIYERSEEASHIYSLMISDVRELFRSFIYDVRGVKANSNHKLSMDQRTELEEVDEGFEATANPHTGHEKLKIALLGVMNEVPDIYAAIPDADLADLPDARLQELGLAEHIARYQITQDIYKQAVLLKDTREEILAVIESYKGVEATRKIFDQRYSAETRVKFFMQAKTNDKYKIYHAATGLCKAILDDMINAWNEGADFLNAYQQQVAAGDIINDANPVINALNYANKPLGPYLQYTAGDNIFDHLCTIDSKYSIVNQYDVTDRAEQPDDVFYVDQIFVRVWHMIRNFQGSVPERRDIERDIMTEAFIKNLKVMYEEGSGHCNCHRGKLEQMVLALQGYFDYANFDTVPGGDDSAPNPYHVATGFFEDINDEFAQADLSDELKFLRDLIIFVDINPEDIDMTKLSYDMFMRVMSSVENEFKASLLTLRQRFKNQVLQQFLKIVDKRVAMKEYEKFIDKWRTCFNDALRSIKIDRLRRLLEGTADDDSAVADRNYPPALTPEEQCRNDSLSLQLILGPNATKNNPHYVALGNTSYWIYGPQKFDYSALDAGVHYLKVTPSGKARREIILKSGNAIGRVVHIYNIGSEIHINKSDELMAITATVGDQKIFEKFVDGPISFEAPYGPVEISIFSEDSEKYSCTYLHESVE